MLRRLTISNYALIRNLDFIPGEGMSIITGETGAGKSIMIGALSLLRGERADSRVIADSSGKSVVEASFTAIPSKVKEKILAIDSEWDDEELILRREISPTGRSRAFINESPVTLSILSDISKDLLDIHSQNSNSLLSDPSIQLSLVDSFAHIEDLLEEYRMHFLKYVALRQSIKNEKLRAERNKNMMDVLTFKLQELDKLVPREGELKEIETRYELLTNAEEIRERLVSAKKALDGSEGDGAMGMIADAASNLSSMDMQILGGESSFILERLNQCYIELKDISGTVETALESINSDPDEMAKLSSRMGAYYSALKRFNVTDDKELSLLHRELKRDFESVQNGETEINQLESRARKIALELKKMANNISVERRKAAGEVALEIEREAKHLGLENLKFEIAITPVKLSKTGGDLVDFKAAFNKNQTPESVGKIASGGEMARLMLAIKKVSSSRLELPTVIFDEIDTGVSGKIADKMGEMMSEMGKKMQIITITHLPQVAAKGDRHFKVYKEDKDDRTVSDVMLLSDKERVSELARMLSGKIMNDAALENARSLLRDSN